jgi:methionyl aminopeptidase
MKRDGTIRIHTALEQRKMLYVSIRLLELLRQIEGEPLIGVETVAVERFVRRYFRRYGLNSAMESYRGYPSVASICINDVAIHGIPGERRISRGDIVSLDIAARSDGFVGDTAWTYYTPGVSSKNRDFIYRAWRAFRQTLLAVSPHVSIREIGTAAMEAADREGISIIPEFVGHGIGRELHEAPVVPFQEEGKFPEGNDVTVRPGMILNIEPVYSGGGKDITLLDDGWGYRISDGSVSAHFELSLLVAEDEVRVLQFGGIPAQELPEMPPFGAIQH